MAAALQSRELFQSRFSAFVLLPGRDLRVISYLSTVDHVTNYLKGYSRRMDVVNRGLSGYNTSQALEVLSQVIPSPSNGKVEYMVLTLPRHAEEEFIFSQV